MVITDFYSFLGKTSHCFKFWNCPTCLAQTLFWGDLPIIVHPNSTKKGRKNTKKGRIKAIQWKPLCFRCQLTAERQKPESHTEGNVVSRMSQLIGILCFITFCLKVILVFEHSTPNPGLPEWTRIQFQNTFIG